MRWELEEGVSVGGCVEKQRRAVAVDRERESERVSRAELGTGGPLVRLRAEGRRAQYPTMRKKRRWQSGKGVVEEENTGLWVVRSGRSGHR